MSPLATPKTDRRIAHLDRDAFYAFVELQRHPELKGQPAVPRPQFDKDMYRMRAKVADQLTSLQR